MKGSQKSHTNPGFSGLEAAIVLIAFVVIAAFFSYALLGTGFFATSKAQDTANTGMKQASSGIYIEGSLYGGIDEGPGQLQKLTFYVAIPETGMNMDLRDMLMAYTKSDTPLPQSLTLGDTAGSLHFSTGNGGPYSTTILMAGEKTRINFADLNGPVATGWFTIEIKPQNGPSYLLQRYLPEGYQGGVIR